MLENVQNIAESYAEEYVSDAIYPAHLMKAVLHKEVGIVPFIENDLDKDYYYLLDWADVQCQLAPRATKPKRGLELSKESEEVIREAENYKDKFGISDDADADTKATMEAICLLAAIVTPGVGFTFDQLKTLPLTASEICKVMGDGSSALANTDGGYPSPSALAATPGAAPKGKSGNIEKYCIDKIKEVREGKIGTIIGFEKELQIIYETLGRKYKSNILITGEAGVGKTALVGAFVTKLANGEVPEFMKGAKAYEVDLAALASDAQYKGEIDDRFKNILSTVEEHSTGNTILIIEGIHKLFEKNGELWGCASLLKQELTKGTLLLIATASIDGYTKNIETDKEVVSKLEKLTVEEPTAEACLEILKGALPAYVEFHKVTVDEGVMEDAIRLAKRYLNEKALPDSAFDLLDRAMSEVKIRPMGDGVEVLANTDTDQAANSQQPTPNTKVLQSSDLESIVAKIKNMPLGKVQTSERDKLLGAEETMKQRVIGQDHAIKKVIDSVFESRSGLNKKGQPMGSFFFLGPTGTGKTELAKTLAEFLFGDESALLRFDMSEFKEEHSVALLYGAPPGYVGYEEGGLLVNKIRQTPYSVVLFDEIEKAHKSVFDLFLQILDEGKLHDRLGRVGDFSNAIILFTSNIGSKDISKRFLAGDIPSGTDMLETMQQYFRPEFLARLTEIVPFAPITDKTVVQIFDIHLKGLHKLLAEQNMTLELDDEAKKAFAMKGFDPQYGARQIIGNIRKFIRQPLSKMIISGEAKPGDTIVGKADSTFEVKGKKTKK